MIRPWGQGSVAEKDKFGITPPSLSLPKGGDAIRGIGEEFRRKSGHRKWLDERADRDQPFRHFSGSDRPMARHPASRNGSPIATSSNF